MDRGNGAFLQQTGLPDNLQLSQLKGNSFQCRDGCLFPGRLWSYRKTGDVLTALYNLYDTL